MMSPDTPSSAVTVIVRVAAAELDMTRVWLLKARDARDTGAQVRFCAAAAAVRFGALRKSADEQAPTLFVQVSHVMQLFVHMH